MLQKLGQWWTGLRQKILRPRPPSISAQSSFTRILRYYPNAKETLRDRFGLSFEDPREESRKENLTLEQICTEYRLPHPRIVFMEIQLRSQNHQLRYSEPKEIHRRLQSEEPIQLLDVRETWESKLAVIPGSIRVDPQRWQEIIENWNKQTPVVVYCHFGVRSADAAFALMQEGFQSVQIVRGGIDAWSLEVDPNIPRYESAWC